MAEIIIEVAYALPDRQVLRRLVVPEGTTLRQAIEYSMQANHFPGLDVAGSSVGVFGRAVASPDEYVLEAGDRVEFYRPLIADPKEVRKQRAARAAQMKDDEPGR